LAGRTKTDAQTKTAKELALPKRTVDSNNVAN